MGRVAEASEAYAQAARRMPAKGAETAQLLADYADVLAMSQGRTLQGAPEKLIARSLAADPRNVKALALAGSAAFERKDFKESIRYWEQLLAAAPADAEFTASIRSSIAEARERAGLPATGGASKADAKAAAPAGRVTGEVSLAPVLQSKVKGDDTVFVFARAAEGPRMPLAIARYKASDLPIRYTLDDSQAMSPQMKLSGFPRVVVGARVSRSGDATPRPGDLEGASEAVSVGAGSVDIVIGREVR
jgi:cytochrome c-type biogenesis protein CcmH